MGFPESGVLKFRLNLELRGADLVIVDRLPRTVLGTTISIGVIASAHGLFEMSSGTALFPVLLSLLRSRILLDSPRTAPVRVKPDELDPEFESDTALVDTELEVSMTSPRLGDLPRKAASSSTHPAGVGGTGPREDCI